MIDTIYTDEHLALVVKPIGLSSQAEANGKDCLPKRLEEQGLSVKAVHRLDKGTGGVMVYARTDKAAAALSAMVGNHQVFCKDYLAVVAGCPNEESDTFKDLLYHDVRRNKSYIVKNDRKGVRLAKLEYRVLETVTTEQGTFSLVSVRLHTGRTHQIRVQFAGRQMPLAGDGRYGGLRGVDMGLWSCRLTFPHPITGSTVSGESRPNWTHAPWCWFKKV